MQSLVSHIVVIISTTLHVGAGCRCRFCLHHQIGMVTKVFFGSDHNCVTLPKYGIFEFQVVIN